MKRDTESAWVLIVIVGLEVDARAEDQRYSTRGSTDNEPPPFPQGHSLVQLKTTLLCVSRVGCPHATATAEGGETENRPSNALQVWRERSAPLKLLRGAIVNRTKYC